MIRALAIAYAIGVVLAAPVTLHAADDTAVKIETVPEAPAPEPPATQMVPAAPEAAPDPEPPKPEPIAVKAAPGSVRMLDFRFSPATITVNAGESVTWVNAGEEPHNAVGDNFSTALLNAGKSGSESFATAGTFSYICTVHPQMKGTVKVVAAQTEPQSDTEESDTEDDVAASEGADEPTGPQLAKGGLDAWLLGMAGVAMLVMGLAISRRVA